VKIVAPFLAGIVSLALGLGNGRLVELTLGYDGFEEPLPFGF
jgi:hypothetical protein